MFYFAISWLSLMYLIGNANAYWLMGANNILTTERIDPIVNPGQVSAHSHTVLGGSNFGFNTNTKDLQASRCTSIPIAQDKSNYWFPNLYFQWANGSFTSVTSGGAVMYVLINVTQLAQCYCTDYMMKIDTPGLTAAFPENFRMLSGDVGLRTYNASDFSQQAVSYVCLDFSGEPIRYTGLPPTTCSSGIRVQINFPSCWDGQNTDSPDRKSHVAFLSTGPDTGNCSDPRYPITLPRIFLEMYWVSQNFDPFRANAANVTQPFVFSYGDPTGYGYHADFINGWEEGVLQNAVDRCHCNPYGDPTCCADAGIFNLNPKAQCYITLAVDEAVDGTLARLPGNNPVQEDAPSATASPDTTTPAIISPVCAYTGAVPPSMCTSSNTSATNSAVGGSGAAPLLFLFLSITLALAAGNLLVVVLP